MANDVAAQFLRELEAEAPATRKCLEKIPADAYDFKPHQKSMKMIGLVSMGADMPRWISFMIKDRVIDFATYPQWQPKSAEEAVRHLDESMEGARKGLQGLADEDLGRTFELKNEGQLLWSVSVRDAISSTIHHWVHHRGQMTVYMRLKDLPVPSIYGPSADEQAF